MSDQVHLNQPAAKKVETFSRLLHPMQLRATAPRDLVLQAMKFEKIEVDFAERFREKTTTTRVCILASDSSQHFAAILKLYLYGEGLRPEIIASKFDGIAIHAFDPASEFWSNVGDEIIVLPALRDLGNWPSLFAEEAKVVEWVENAARALIATWEKATEANPACRIYQATFVEPLLRPLGNLELQYPFSRTQCIRRLNQYLVDVCPPNVCLIDLEYFSGLVGKTEWFDEAAFCASKQPFAIRVMPLVASFVSRLISARRGGVKKCLVLDLDNTLWGGVIGDDGVDGLRLSPSDPVGEAFLTFQAYVKSLKERGVILAACSKNDDATAREAFARHPDMLLKESDFASFQANWDDKHDNIRRIAADLNIGLDSLVFFDDNPAERMLVSQFLPDVWVIDVPSDPALFCRALQLTFAFEWPNLTSEDLVRADTYALQRHLPSLENTPDDYRAYLRSLKMEASILPVPESGLTRFYQLANKTNQFNLRTVRYGEAEIRDRRLRTDYLLLDVRLRDVSINYGSISNVVLRFLDDAVFIENWVMSCRTFKRGVENAVFEVIKKIARDHSKEFVVGEYLPTAKNSYVAELLPNFGMTAWIPPDPSVFGIDHGQLFRGSVEELKVTSHEIEVVEAL